MKRPQQTELEMFTLEPERSTQPRTETARGAYCNTPHQTIEQLAATAKQRSTAGEDPFSIIQDLVNGYSLGWQSANHRIIEEAVNNGK